MRSNETPSPQGSLNFQEVLFIVFRHKWKILILTLLGLGAAAGVYLSSSPTYVSKAKLLVRYVLERSAVDPFEIQTGTAGRSGASVINTEVELLTSEDLVLDVIEIIGMERLLGEEAEEPSILAAAKLVSSGLSVGSSMESNVLHVSFEHEDPEVARDVLREFVTRYFDRHLDIHRSIGAFDFVTEKTDLIRGQLRTTEEELRKLKAEAGIINLDESITNLGSQMRKTREDLLAAEASLVEQEARLNALVGSGGGEEGEGAGSETGEASGVAAGMAVELAPPPPATAIAEYEALSVTLSSMNERKLELLTKYTPRSSIVRAAQETINQAKAQRSALLEKHPGLVATPTMAMTRDGVVQAPLFSITDEKAKLAAILAKSEKLKLQLKALEQEHGQLATLSTKIKELERRKGLEEEKFRYLESSLEKARADEALDPSKIPNISIVQRPTAARRSYSDFVKKLIFGLAASGIVTGLGLAFLIELFLDRSVKRPQELEARLHIPLMLAIPYHSKHRRAPRLTLSEGNEPAPRLEGGKPGGGEEIVIPDHPSHRDEEAAFLLGSEGHFILPYTIAIRDRIVYQMELNERNHKPKLVALTGFSTGAGTTTIAAGLAKAFAESGGMKVLLVDLSTPGGAANGSPDRIQTQSLDSALQAGRELSFHEGEDNLYLARVTPKRDRGGEHAFSPQHLYELMPELRSSEFDYIIFDMPPVGPTSPTVAMAGIMDQVLLVLDAEKTDRDTLKRTHAELSRGQADVSCVFNKARHRAPRWVEGGV